LITGIRGVVEASNGTSKEAKHNEDTTSNDDLG